MLLFNPIVSVCVSMLVRRCIWIWMESSNMCVCVWCMGLSVFVCSSVHAHVWSPCSWWRLRTQGQLSFPRFLATAATVWLRSVMGGPSPPSHSIIPPEPHRPAALSVIPFRRNTPLFTYHYLPAFKIKLNAAPQQMNTLEMSLDISTLGDRSALCELGAECFGRQNECSC